MGEWVAEAIKWGAILIIAIMYRKGITDALSGASKALASLASRPIKAGSFELGPSTPASQVTPEAIGTTNSAIAVPEIADPIVQEQATFIKNAVEAKLESERMPFLLKETATYVVQSYFYQIYCLIYGSQIQLLLELNQATTVGMDEATVRLRHYDPAVLRDPIFYSTYPFEKWIHFLLNTLLIEARGQSYYIAPRGRAFLQFMVKSSLGMQGVANNAWH